MQSLKDISYFKTGGTASRICAPSTIAELSTLLKELQESQSKFFLLGEGSNSLLSDEHYEGTVITFSKLAKIVVNDGFISCEAGLKNSVFVATCLDSSLEGAAWMAGLPGQIGATTRMNARCYGGEISQIVSKVHCLDRTGKSIVRKPADFFFGYKDTAAMKHGEIVVQIEFKLNNGDQKIIESKMAECEKDRTDKGHFLFPSCGCVFKNDYSVGESSGSLLDKAGAKKLKVGKAEVSPHHANFIYNKGASSREILELSFLMRDLVQKKFGVKLEYEMEILGNIPDPLRDKI